MPTYRVPLTLTLPSGDRSSDVVITPAQDQESAKQIAQRTGEERVQASSGSYAQGRVIVGQAEQIGG